jgi:hypothetical protein
MNHQQFKGFLNDVESEYGDVICYMEFRWVNHGQMLKHVCDLKSEIVLFLEVKWKPQSFVITT